MAELATISRPYANAVFGLAKSEGTLAQWSGVLALLDTTSQQGSVKDLLRSPDLAAVDKASKLAEICAEEITDQGKAFLQSLAEHDRLELIGDVRGQFEELRAEEERSIEVKVTSAYELSASQSEALRAALLAKFNKEITIEASVDASLVGGAIIRAGDIVIDGSVRGRLAKLVDTLVQA
jgi:F-type H+-transporting ATPase subunit delta